MDQTGETCLHWASANNNASMVELLIDSGASPDLRNRDGKLPCELSTMPLIQNICAPTPDEPWAATTQHVGPHDVKFAAIPGGPQLPVPPFGFGHSSLHTPWCVGGGDPEGQINTMLALIAAEQKARAHIQRKLMMLSELQRTLEVRMASAKPRHLLWWVGWLTYFLLAACAGLQDPLRPCDNGAEGHRAAAPSDPAPAGAGATQPRGGREGATG